MRLWSIVLALGLAAGCGPKEEPKKPPVTPPKTPETKAPETKAPETKAPEPAKTTAPATTAPATTAPKTSSGPAQPTATSNLMYACPKAGCTFEEPKKGTCFKHPDTQMVERWFVCAKCSVKKDAKGACEKCGAELVRTVK